MRLISRLSAYILDYNEDIKILKDNLKKYFPIIEILETSDNEKDAIEFLKKNSVDLILLNQDLLNNYHSDFLDLVDKNKFYTIFLTNLNDNRIKSYEYHSANFISRPFETLEYITQINEALRDIENGYYATSELIKDIRKFTQNNGENCEYIVVKSLLKIEYVLKRDIIKMEFDGKYTLVHLVGNKILISTMKFDDYWAVAKTLGLNSET